MSVGEKLAGLAGEAADVVAGLEEPGQEPAADVAGGSGDEDGPAGRSGEHAPPWHDLLEWLAVRLLVTLALRNLLRHKRRTLLTAAALVFGIAIMILGDAWQKATETAVVEPAKLATLGHVQVFAEDAAADEGGEISFIAPQNNYRLIPAPRKVIDTVLREEPRLAAGIARLMVGALLSMYTVGQDQSRAEIIPEIYASFLA